MTRGRYSKLEILFLLLAASTIVAAAWPYLMPQMIGMEYDEAHFLDFARRIAAGHEERIRPPRGIYVFHRPLPFMTMPYVGTLDAPLYALSYAAFGFGPRVSRLTNVAWGILFALVSYALARRLGGVAVAVIATLLLITDLELLLHIPPNFGPFLLQLLFGTLALLVFEKWLAGAGRRYFYLGIVCIGLAFNEKLTFLFTAASMLAAFVAFRFAEVRARLTPRDALLGTLLLLVVLTPVIWFAFGFPAVVFGYGRSATEVTETFGSRLTDRFTSFWTLLSGQLFMMQQLGEVPSSLKRFSAVPYAFYVGLAAMLAAFALRRKPPVMAAVLYAAALGIVLCNVFLRDAGRLHHLLLVYPMPQIAVALMAVWLVRHTLTRHRVAMIIGGGLILATGISTAHNLIWYTAEVQRTGGAAHWSSAIYDLARYIRHHPERHYTFAAWGLERQLSMLAEGRTPMLERYFQLANLDMPAEARNEVAESMKRRDGVWVFSSIMPQYLEIRERVFDIAKTAGLRPKQLVSFYPRAGGTSIYTAFTFENPQADTALFPVKLSHPDWDSLQAIGVLLLDSEDRVVGKWYRSIEWYPILKRDVAFQFGLNEAPEWFARAPADHKGTPVKTRIEVECRKNRRGCEAALRLRPAPAHTAPQE